MKKFDEAVEKNKELILKAHEYIWANPETGYKEVKTSKYLEDAFEKLGYDIVRAENVPGFYTVLDTGRPGPEVLVLGELDSLMCTEHPDADPNTGAVHCCGHSAQCAALLGLAAALKEPGVLDEMSGRIRLCAVPAEELIEIDYRISLKKEGKIKYLEGKPEFLYRGYFDGVDVAFMVHTTQGEGIAIRKGSVGAVAKTVIYKGVSSHAGGSPWNGRNALYAATQGIGAVNAIRETFKEADLIRVHPIITQGGTAVNAIPDTVTIESYTRGSNFEAILAADKKVDCALCGGALSLGTNIEIITMPAFGPLRNSDEMMDVAEEAANPELSISRTDAIGTGSTDMGDLSMVMPVVHPYMPGATGRSHGADYYIINPELACVGSAKWQLNMLYILLKDGGERAKNIAKNYTPEFASKEAYFEYIDKVFSEGNCIEYKEDGTAIVKL